MSIFRDRGVLQFYILEESIFVSNSSCVGMRSLRLRLISFPFSFRTMYDLGWGEVRRTFPRLVKSLFCFEYNLTVELGAIGFKSTSPLLYRSTDEGGGGCSESWWRTFSDGRSVRTCPLNIISAGDIPCFKGVAFKFRSARYGSCLLSFAFSRMRLAVCICLSTRPFDSGQLESCCKSQAISVCHEP